MANVITIGKGECTMGFSWIRGHKCFVTFENDPSGEKLAMFDKEDEMDYEAMNERIDRSDATISFLNEAAIDLLIDKLVQLKKDMNWDENHPIEEYDEVVQEVLNKLGGK